MKLISKMRASSRLKRFIYVSIILFTGVYAFCVPSFGESTSFLRFAIYASMIILGILSLAYCFLFEDFKLNKFCFLVPAFVIYAFIGTATYSHEYREWFSLVLLAGSFFVFAFAFKALKNKTTIVYIVALAFFAFSLYFIIYYRNEILNFSSYGSQDFRLGTHFDNQNGVAAYAIVGLATALYIVLFDRKKIRFAFIVPVLSSLLVGISTGSRTFVLMFVIFLAVFLFFKFQKHKVIYILVLLAMVIVFVILINLPFLSTLKERIIRAIGTIFGTATKADTATIERVVWADYGFYLGFKKLFFGYGVNGFAQVSGVGTYSHSNFAETFCDFGLIGFLLFYSLLVIILFKAIMNKKVDKSFVVSFVAYYLIVSFSNVIYYKKIYYLILAFVFYLTFIDNVEKKSIPYLEKIHRVLFTCDTMGSGGAEKVISVLSNQMSLLDVQVYILGVADTKVPNSFYKLNQNVKYDNLRHKSDKKINPLKRVFLLRKKIKNIKPDVVISFLPNANIYTWISIIGLGIPHVVSERNNPYVDPKEKNIRLLKQLAFKFSNGCVFQTNEARNFYPSCVRSKSTIIKNPIILNCEPSDGLSQKNKTILAVGRLTKQKNYKCLLDAFEMFNKSQNESYLLKIYGDGPLKQELEAYCKSIGIQDRVIFAGNDTNWHEKEKNDAMYILSSDYEGMPNALAEAMALGIPCISTDCPTGGSKELIKDGINGFLVSVNNPEELTAKMIELVSSRNDFYSKTRKMINDYSPENITKQWIDMIKGLTKEIYE